MIILIIVKTKMTEDVFILYEGNYFPMKTLNSFRGNTSGM
jgi:hypothetical protein